jgi:quinol monooxygenase YgiN
VVVVVSAACKSIQRGDETLIHVVAIITTKPGQRGTVFSSFRDIILEVRREEGCVEYRATVDIEGGPDTWAKFGPDTFVVIEKWESREALEAHSASAHMVAYAARVKDLIVSRAIHVLEPL